MISAVLFDLDGVIRLWDPSITGGAEMRHGLPDGAVLRAAFEPALLTSAITGGLSDETWRSTVADTLAATYGDRARHAVRDWSASAGEVDWRVLELVRAQRVRRRVALISNATSRLETDLAELGIDREFEAVFNSCDLGCAKPDPAIFVKACHALEVRPDECALVDDSAVNIRAAQDLGLAAHLYRDSDDLAEFLAGLCGPQ